MADARITDLTDGAAIKTTDELVVARAGANKKIAGSEVMDLLAIVSYAAHGSSYTTTSATLVDVDATNLAVTFVVPDSGKVLIRATCSINTGAVVNSFLGLRESSSIVAGPVFAADTSNGSVDVLVSMPFYVTGLTPGSSHTYKLAFAINSGQTMSIRNASSTNPVVIEVWRAP